MKCNGVFTYKSITKRDSGEFTNDKGEVIKYDSSYLVQVDEIAGDKITERKFKFPSINTGLADKFKQFKPYERINVDFDVTLYNGNAKIVPVDVSYLIDDIVDEDFND